MNKEELAKMFHETYERLAPAFGWKTKKGCKVPFEQLPDRNKALMVATCQTILAALQNENNNTAVALLNELSSIKPYGRSVVSDKAYEILERCAQAQSLPQALTTGSSLTEQPLPPCPYCKVPVEKVLKGYRCTSCNRYYVETELQ